MITASYASLPYIRASAVIIFKSVGYTFLLLSAGLWNFHLRTA
ncbi:hypothetical protein [Symbiopectobacterium purcellii]